MEDIIMVTTLMNMCCFLIGAIVGLKSKGENIKIPNPIKTVKDINVKKEIKKEIERDKIINENIDNYNGTPLGQQDIPR